jgi:photosystem II stability/assembly factor-like uncharacterized protein
MVMSRLVLHVAPFLLATGLSSASLELLAQSTPTRRPAATQPARQPRVQRDTTLSTSLTVYDSTVFAGLKWREIGPYRGGRSVAVAGSAARPFEYWMGTTGGGVFKTTDGGITWTPMTDKYFGGTIGAIGVSESNPDIVYVGGGEFPIRGNVSHGDGVWKTTDAGKTWTFMGLGDTRQISRVRVHPKDPNIVYVAAQGHVFGPNPERGVFRSRDGGKSWQKILFRNDSTGAADLTIDPANPNVMYAGFWQAGRKPWQLISGGPGGGLFKSLNGGDTWTEITRNPGLPKGLIGNIGIAISPAKPSRVWAIIEADSGGVFRSDDGGANWTLVNSERKLRQRAWYYTKLYADPRDTNVVYVSNVAFHKSTDGGKTYRAVRIPHSDSHDLWIAPNDSRRMIEGNDGGANVSFNGGQSWSEQDYATAQFYHVITTNHFPYHVCGAQQDNSTLCGPSRHPGGIDISNWDEVAGGESGYIAVNPTNPDITYGGSYGGYLTRHDRKTGFERNVNPWPNNPMGHSAGDIEQRFQWTFPIMTSPHNPRVLYAASQVLWKTTNEGESWTAISKDLTRNDPRTMGPSGGPITKDQTSVEYYGTIFTFAESPLLPGVIWTGSDDGLIHVTTDGGASWKNVTPPDLPEWTRISIIEPSHHSAGAVYVAANRYQLDDHAPYLYRSGDFGKTWQRIDNGIDRGEFTRVIREDPVKRGLLYSGTERGVWVSFNDGRSWQKLQINLPPVPIHDLAVKEGDLVAGTHGRSFWILDDVSPLRQLNDAVIAKEAHLFDPTDPWRVNWGGGGRGSHPAGQNPASGALVYYWLKSPRQTVTLDFLDRNGAVIKSFTSLQDSATAADSIRGDSTRKVREDSLRRAGVTPDSTVRMQARSEESPPDEDAPRVPRPPRVPNKAGTNSFAWNLRYPDASTFEGMIMWAGGIQGPVAPPGTYSVRMKVNGQEIATRSFELKKDPRTPATLSDIREQFAFLTKIRDRTSVANDAVKTIRSVKKDVEDRRKKIPVTNLAAFEMVARPLVQGLSEVEDSIYQTKNRSGQDPLNYPIRLNNKIAALSGVVATTDARPTQQSYAVFTRLSMKLDLQILKMEQLMKDLLPRVNDALKNAGLAPILKPGPIA